MPLPVLITAAGSMFQKLIGSVIMGAQKLSQTHLTKVILSSNITKERLGIP